MELQHGCDNFPIYSRNSVPLTKIFRFFQPILLSSLEFGMLSLSRCWTIFQSHSKVVFYAIVFFPIVPTFSVSARLIRNSPQDWMPSENYYFLSFKSSLISAYRGGLIYSKSVPHFIVDQLHLALLCPEKNLEST